MEERASSSPPARLSSPQEPTIKDDKPNPGNAIQGKGKRKAGELEQENCVICLEPIPEKCVASPCRHAYHYICILQWLEVRMACPLCNALVSELHVYTKNGHIYKHHIEPYRVASAPVSTASSLRRSQLSLRIRSYVPHRSRRRHASLPEPDWAILRRRYIYKHKLRSLYVGSNRMSCYRNVTSQDFHTNEELVSRARMWVRRELQVWEWTSTNAEFLIEYIIGILKSVDLRGSAGQAEEMMAEFLGRENSQIFIHELSAFLRSPYTTLAAFDSFAQYGAPIPKSFGTTSHGSQAPLPALTTSAGLPSSQPAESSRSRTFGGPPSRVPV